MKWLKKIKFNKSWVSQWNDHICSPLGWPLWSPSSQKGWTAVVDCGKWHSPTGRTLCLWWRAVLWALLSRAVREALGFTCFHPEGGGCIDVVTSSWSGWIFEVLQKLTLWNSKMSVKYEHKEMFYKMNGHLLNIDIILFCIFTFWSRSRLCIYILQFKHFFKGFIKKY